MDLLCRKAHSRHHVNDIPASNAGYLLVMQPLSLRLSNRRQRRRLL